MFKNNIQKQPLQLGFIHCLTHLTGVWGKPTLDDQVGLTVSTQPTTNVSA